MAPRNLSGGVAPSTPVKQGGASARVRTPTSASRSLTAGKTSTPVSRRVKNADAFGMDAPDSARYPETPKTPKRAAAAAAAAGSDDAPRAEPVKSGEGIVVAVRVRDFLPREDHDKLVVLMENTTTQLTHRNAKKHFEFDHCLWSIPDTDERRYKQPFATQSDVYDRLGSPVVDNAMKGFNSSVIAYGQTGSGKSYSVFGPQNSLGDTEREGLIPRVCRELFARIAAKREECPESRFEVCASMLELYKEQVYDLLNNKEKLKIRSNGTGGFVVPGCKQHKVTCYEDVSTLLRKGESRKTYAATAMNERSSRAHTIFELLLKEKISQPGSRQVTKTAKLTLCDLAGCERCKDAKTEVGGKEFAEACQINMSLLCLGKCVETVHQKGSNALVTEFRASALTKLLKDSIGGNSKTVILVTLSPSEADSHNTSCALMFANRAKSLKNHAVINVEQAVEVTKQKHLLDQQCQQRIEEVKMGFELEKERADLANKQLLLDDEASRLQEEKQTLDAQRREMQRKGLSEADKKRLEQRESELTKKLHKAKSEQDEVAAKVYDLEMKLYTDTQAAERDRQELEERVETLVGTVEYLESKHEDDKAEWEDELERQSSAHREKLEELSGKHQAAVEAKEHEFVKERKSYLQNVMGVVSNLHKDMEEKEAKWRKREDEWKKKLHEASGSSQAKLNDVQNRLSERTLEFERHQDELVAAKWGQEEGQKRIQSLQQELAEVKLQAKRHEESLLAVKTSLQDSLIETSTRIPELPAADSADADCAAVSVYVEALVEAVRSAKTDRDEVFNRLTGQMQKANQMQVGHDEQLAQEREHWERQLKETRKCVEGEKVRHSEARAELGKQMEQLEHERASTMGSVSEATAEMERRIASLTAKHAEELASVAQQHQENLENTHTCHNEAVDATRAVYKQEIDDLTQQMSQATKSKHAALVEKEQVDSQLQQEREEKQRIEEQARQAGEDFREERETLAAELSALEARWTEQEALLYSKTRSLEEAQDMIQHTTSDKGLYEKRHAAAKKKLDVCYPPPLHALAPPRLDCYDPRCVIPLLMGHDGLDTHAAVYSVVETTQHGSSHLFFFVTPYKHTSKTTRHHTHHTHHNPTPTPPSLPPLQEQEAVIESLREEIRGSRRQQNDSLDSLYAEKRKEMESLRKDMEQKVDGMTQERTRLLEERVTMKQDCQTKDDKAREHATELKRERAKREADAAKLKAMEAKHKAQMDQLCAKIKEQQKLHAADLDEERENAKRLQKENADLKANGSVAAQKLLESYQHFQQSQLNFQAQLEDEAKQARKKAAESVSPPRRMPLAESVSPDKGFSQSLNDILNTVCACVPTLSLPLSCTTCFCFHTHTHTLHQGRMSVGLKSCGSVDRSAYDDSESQMSSPAGSPAVGSNKENLLCF